MVDIPGAQWLQLRFENLDLGDATLTITAADQESQTFNAEQLEAWGSLSAVFNGQTVTVSRSDSGDVLIADVVIGLPAQMNEAETTGAAQLRGIFDGQLDRFIAPDINRNGSDGIILENAGDDATVEAICDGQDNRTASSHPFVARIVPVGCTAWLIPGGRMLTAAHCTGAMMQTVEFNPPASLADGTVQAPPVRDQYRVDAGSIRQSARTIAGDDWAVFDVLPNTQTRLAAITAQGGSFTLSNTNRPTDITVTGHGVDGPAPDFGRNPQMRNADNQTQQTHSGRVVQNDVQSATQATIRYETDTQGGNSGGPIIASGGGNVAVGIHTFGSCAGNTNRNGGTSFRNAALWAEVSPVGPTIQAPGMGSEGAGAGIAMSNLNGNPRPEMVAAVYDDPERANTFRYRVGRDIGNDGVAASWSDIVQVPGVGWEGQGAGVALHNLGGSARPEMILMAYDNPQGANTFRYRVGRDVDANGVAGSWSGSIQVPGVGWEGAGADLAIVNLDGNPRPEMILMAYDDPSSGNTFRYRVGANLDSNGAAASWGPILTVPGVGWEGAGAGMAIGDYGGGSRPDIILMAYDDPEQDNSFRYRIGFDLDAQGRATRWEADWIGVPGVGWEGQGAGLATIDLDGDSQLDLVNMAYDNPAQSNTIRYRVVRNFR